MTVNDLLLIAMIAFVLFAIGDLIVYGHAKFPERTHHWYYKLPGGGFGALLKLGGDK